MTKLAAVAFAGATLAASAAFAQQPYQGYSYGDFQNTAVPCNALHDSWHDGEHCNIGPKVLENQASQPANRRSGSTFGAYGSAAGR